MSFQKPKTAAPSYSNRKHKRTSSQPSIKTTNVATNYHSRGTTPMERINFQEFCQTKIDCSKLFNFNIFNIEFYWLK